MKESAKKGRFFEKGYTFAKLWKDKDPNLKYPNYLNYLNYPQLPELSDSSKVPEPPELPVSEGLLYMVSLFSQVLAGVRQGAACNI